MGAAVSFAKSAHVDSLETQSSARLPMPLNAGGAAASAGSEYQERINAWFAAAMLSELEIHDYFEIEQLFQISSLSFQAATAVDDLVVHGGELTLFCQTKRSLTLSDADGSEFRSAIDQCVRAWLARQPDT